MADKLSFYYSCLLGDQFTVQLLNCLLQRCFHLLYYFAITLLATFLLGISLIYFVQYYSYFAVLYSCYNICNSCSFCGHVTHSARDATTRTRLYWDGSTCAQAGLKYSPIQSQLSYLKPMDHSIVGGIEAQQHKKAHNKG